MNSHKEHCGCTPPADDTHAGCPHSSCGCGCGHSYKEMAAPSNGTKLTKGQKIMVVRMAITGAMLLGLHFVPAEGILKFGLYLVPYFFMGYDILLEAWEGILHRKIFNVNFLMSVATIGALVLGLTSTGDYTEAVAVMLFYQVGEWFEGFAIAKSRRSITQLMDIRPDYASIEEDGRLRQVSPESLPVGSIVVVQPGEKVPLDGIVMEGTSTLNTLALTGESLPQDVMAGQQVASGTINLTGRLTIKTTKTFTQSTVAKIMELVEQAGERKTTTETFIMKFARVYTPVVCYSALALFLCPPLLQIILKNEPLWTVWLYRSLTFLVISCPCALVISIPLTFFAGIGGASREGILIKGSNFMEALAKTDTMVFDKTGTLTEGVFKVTAINENPRVKMSATSLLEYAALCECNSSHPISRSIVAAYGREPDRSLVKDVKEIAGLGIVAQVKNQRVAVGNIKLMAQEGIQPAEIQDSQEATTIHVAIDGIYGGNINLEDSIKASVPEALTRLRQVGIRKFVLLTGDNSTVAQKVGCRLAIEQVESQLLPGDKVAKLEEILAAQEGGRVAFVGDGINDAPVLSRSDVGIAMGGLGSDAAIEAADIILMDDNLAKIPKAIKISRKTLGVARQNIGFALGVKFSCMILGAMGITTMWLAIFADVGVMVLAVLNAIRALRVKKL